MKLTEKIGQVVRLLVCVLMVLSVAIVQTGKWLGHDLRESGGETAAVDSLRVLADGTVVVNTQPLASDVVGYAGTVPLEITVKNGVVADVKALENAETPNFFEHASVLLDQWKGKRVDEAMAMQVDAVSGATLSSRAIIENVHRGLRCVTTVPAASRSAADEWLSWENAAGLVVVLLAAVLPLYIKSRKYHVAQLVLNVVVLGFWCGAFLSWSALIGWLSDGMTVVATLVPLVMLVTAFVYPLFGRKSHYCTFVCPFGSAQQLAGKCVKYKLPMGTRLVRGLDAFRQVLWAALMLCLWGGVWAEWVDYEQFSAFVFQSASWVVIAVAVLFVLLSVVVVRPYCRFVCPLGTLLKISQSSK